MYETLSLNCSYKHADTNMWEKTRTHTQARTHSQTHTETKTVVVRWKNLLSFCWEKQNYKSAFNLFIDTHGTSTHLPKLPWYSFTRPWACTLSTTESLCKVSGWQSHFRNTHTLLASLLNTSKSQGGQARQGLWLHRSVKLPSLVACYHLLSCERYWLWPEAWPSFWTFL